jgi:ribosomal protein S21
MTNVVIRISVQQSGWERDWAPSVEVAIKKLKSAALRTGLFRGLKEREGYRKPSDRRRLKSAMARKKQSKAMRRVLMLEREREAAGRGVPPAVRFETLCSMPSSVAASWTR